MWCVHSFQLSFQLYHKECIPLQYHYDLIILSCAELPLLSNEQSLANFIVVMEGIEFFARLLGTKGCRENLQRQGASIQYDYRNTTGHSMSCMMLQTNPSGSGFWLGILQITRRFEVLVGAEVLAAFWIRQENQVPEVWTWVALAVVCRRVWYESTRAAVGCARA